MYKPTANLIQIHQFKIFKTLNIKYYTFLNHCLRSCIFKYLYFGYISYHSRFLVFVSFLHVLVVSTQTTAGRQIWPKQVDQHKDNVLSIHHNSTNSLTIEFSFNKNLIHYSISYL